MIRALRDTDTSMFIKADGGQTKCIDMAQCFASFDDAVAFCKENRLTNVELVARMEDHSEFTVPVPPWNLRSS
jgi:hypothetical protein